MEIALQFLKGRRSAQGCRSQARRPPHGRRPAVPLSHPLRGSQPLADHHFAAAGDHRVDLGEVVSGGVRPTRRPRFSMFELLVQDGTGTLRAVWSNQPFLNDVIQSHQRVVLFGKVEMTSRGLQIPNPQFEIVRHAASEAGQRGATTSTLHTGRIVPVYDETGQPSRRRCSAACPRGARSNCRRHGVRSGSARRSSRGSSWSSPARVVGGPLSDVGDQRRAVERVQDAGQRRLVFEEFFVFQLG